jgi:hypothetical protein
MPQKIIVHEKVLAHLSRGLYRSPASALRELVSNAWDANATQVFISTNYPQFAQIAVQDNGDGFTREDFKKLMSGGIGNSEKRQGGEAKLIHNRPTIGRLGIGLLGIAQICGSFEVASKPTTGEPFRAQVRLYDVIGPKLDADDPSIVRDEAAEGDGAIEVDVGEYDFIESADIARGTRIRSEDVHPTFIRSFRESLAAPEFQEPPLDWSKCVDIVSGVHSLHQLGHYWRLLWELSAACPLPYVSGAAVPNDAIKEIQKRLAGYNFSVSVDGIRLAKPVLMDGNPGGYTVEKIPIVSRKVYNKQLEFDGYIAVQEGSQLKPDELRGIMIRLKDVGVGYYDASFLDYPWNEGPRAKWVTGELFVSAGLEDALNIDRDSFNRFHPEFRALQEHVHDILHRNLFPEVYRELRKRSASKGDERERTRTSDLREVVSHALGTKVKISRGSTADRDLVAVDKVEDQVHIAFGDLSLLRTKKSQRQLAASVLALYDLASRERGEQKQRERFEELLLALLSRW